MKGLEITTASFHSCGALLNLHSNHADRPKLRSRYNDLIDGKEISKKQAVDAQPHVLIHVRSCRGEMLATRRCDDAAAGNWVTSRFPRQFVVMCAFSNP